MWRKSYLLLPLKSGQICEVGLWTFSCEDLRIHLALFCLCSLNHKDIPFLLLFFQQKRHWLFSQSSLLYCPSLSCKTVTILQPFSYTACSWNNMYIFYLLGHVSVFLSILFGCTSCVVWEDISPTVKFDTSNERHKRYRQDELSSCS